MVFLADKSVYVVPGGMPTGKRLPKAQNKQRWKAYWKAFLPKFVDVSKLDVNCMKVSQDVTGVSCYL